MGRDIGSKEPENRDSFIDFMELQKTAKNCVKCPSCVDCGEDDPNNYKGRPLVKAGFNVMRSDDGFDEAARQASAGKKGELKTNKNDFDADRKTQTESSKWTLVPCLTVMRLSLSFTIHPSLFHLHLLQQATWTLCGMSNIAKRISHSMGAPRRNGI